MSTAEGTITIDGVEYPVRVDDATGAAGDPDVVVTMTQPSLTFEFAVGAIVPDEGIQNRAQRRALQRRGRRRDGTR